LSESHKDFFQNVYDIVRLIPSGKVTTYGSIAKYLSSSKASRMVGWAMNNAHSIADVPAHRVVNRNGLLTGKMHFATPKTMETLLQKEGVKVKDDKIVDFKEKFWDPSSELKL